MIRYYQIISMYNTDIFAHKGQNKMVEYVQI
jgi:hypothetical protein